MKQHLHAGPKVTHLSQSATQPYCLLEALNHSQQHCFFVIELSANIRRVQPDLVGKSVTPSELGKVIFSGFGDLTQPVLDYIQQHYGITPGVLH